MVSEGVVDSRSLRRGLLALLVLVPFGWAGAGQTGRPDVGWGEKVQVASGGGYKGPWRMNQSDFNYVDDPTVAISERGIIAIAWVDQLRKDVFFQALEPDGSWRFDEPVNVSRTPRVFSWLPRVLIMSGDATEIHVLWQEIVFSGGSHGGEIFFARSTDGGSTFSDPLNLSKSTAGDGKGRLTPRIWDNGSLDIAAGPEGNIYAAWTEYEGSLWFSRSTTGGKNFTQPLQIAGEAPSKPTRAPSIAVDPDGTVYLAWTVGEDAAADIRVVRSLDAGRSFDERHILRSRGHSDAPKIACDNAGTVHLVFAESPGGLFERYHIRYTRMLEWERGFEESKGLSQPQSQQFASISFPALSVGRDDNIYVVWELFPNRRTQPRGLGFTFSSDGGLTFASPSIVPGTLDPALGVNGSQQGMLTKKLAANQSGRIAITNSSFKRGEGSQVFLFRGQFAPR
jgi:hypothetical protein